MDIGTLRRQLKTYGYTNIDQTTHDILDFFAQYYANFKLHTEHFRPGKGKEVLRMCIRGLLPVKYEGTHYTVPLDIWLCPGHPKTPPVVMVVPAENTKLNVSGIVDQTGSISIHWKETSFLKELMKSTAEDFSRKFPVYSTVPVARGYSADSGQAERSSSHLSEKTSELVQLHESVQQKEIEKRALASQLQQRESEIALKDVQIIEKDEEIARLHQRLQEASLQQDRNLSTHQSEFWQVPREEVRLSDIFIGAGAWGIVKKGTFRGVKVAVKSMHEDLASPHTLELTRREINLMSQVRHPSLVLFIAAVVDERGPPMIITELLDMSLRSALSKSSITDGKLSIVRDVAAALNYLHLHRHPIVHRDISSSNVLLQSLGLGRYLGKLSDFGSANLVRMATTPAPGAIFYAAPETLTDVHKAQSPSMDVYSFGVLVCETLTGEFPDTSKLQGMLEQVHASSPRMHRLVTQCINKDAPLRPKMGIVLQELDGMRN